MKGYLARWTGCCGTTSVDLGWYSSIVMVCASARVQDHAATRILMCCEYLTTVESSCRLPVVGKTGFQAQSTDNRQPTTDNRLLQSRLPAPHGLGIFKG